MSKICKTYTKLLGKNANVYKFTYTNLRKMKQ